LLEDITESDPQHCIKAAKFRSGTKAWLPLSSIANLTQAQDDKRNGETQKKQLGEARLFQGYSELRTFDLFKGSKQRERFRLEKPISISAQYCKIKRGFLSQ
jgi:hypothetical protein